MDEIKAHTIRGFRSLPKRGAEIGGVLLGSRNPQDGEILIDSFEPIQIEYLSGPSYIPSDADDARWHDWICALREASPSIVGVCRSHTRPGLRATAEDNDLIQRIMPQSDGVLLIVKPLSDRECVGAFFPFVQAVVTDGATPSREFPFGAAAEPPEPEKPKLRPLSRWVTVSAIAAGIAAATAAHYLKEPAADNPLAGVSYPINSSSDTSQTKPSAAPPSSAGSGEAAVKSEHRRRVKRAF